VLVVIADFVGGTAKDRDVWISCLTVGPLVPDITVLLVKNFEINLLVFLRMSNDVIYDETKMVRNMTYIVSSGALNSTHSLVG